MHCGLHLLAVLSFLKLISLPHFWDILFPVITYFVFSTFVSIAGFSSSSHPLFVKIQGFCVWPFIWAYWAISILPTTPGMATVFNLMSFPRSRPTSSLPTGHFQQCLPCITKISNSEVCAFLLRWDPPPSHRFDEKHPLSLLKRTCEDSRDLPIVTSHLRQTAKQ